MKGFSFLSFYLILIFRKIGLFAVKSKRHENNQIEVY